MFGLENWFRVTMAILVVGRVVKLGFLITFLLERRRDRLHPITLPTPCGPSEVMTLCFSDFPKLTAQSAS